MTLSNHQRAVVQQMVDALMDAHGNIHPGRSFADALDADIAKALGAGQSLLSEPIPEAGLTLSNHSEREPLPGFIRRRIEQAINESANPSHGGMHLGDGKVRVLGADLNYMLAWIDRAAQSTPAAPQAAGPFFCEQCGCIGIPSEHEHAVAPSVPLQPPQQTDKQPDPEVEHLTNDADEGSTGLRPCPFCGKAHTLKVTPASELADEPEDYMHTESYAVMCDAARPLGPGGCGSSGGFFPTEAEAVEAWNRRASPPLALTRDRPTNEHSAVTTGVSSQTTGAAVQSEPDLELAARFVERRRDSYVDEHGHNDPDTGATEFPGDGAEYVQELTEIAEGIRELSTPSQLVDDLTALVGRLAYSLKKSNPASDLPARASDYLRRHALTSPLPASTPPAAVSAEPDFDALHAAIMNLPRAVDVCESGDYRTGYSVGHRDARHAAAELVAAMAGKPAGEQSNG